MKRILAIDGGGIRGTFSAAFLANLEKDLEHPIGRYFDLISGTSTGGIIAIGLALGMRAEEILKLYEEKGTRIFAQSGSGLPRGYIDVSELGSGSCGVRNIAQHRSAKYWWRRLGSVG